MSVAASVAECVASSPHLVEATGVPQIPPFGVCVAIVLCSLSVVLGKDHRVSKSGHVALSYAREKVSRARHSAHRSSFCTLVDASLTIVWIVYVRQFGESAIPEAVAFPYQWSSSHETASYWSCLPPYFHILEVVDLCVHGCLGYHLLLVRCLSELHSASAHRCSTSSANPVVSVNPHLLVVLPVEPATSGGSFRAL